MSEPPITVFLENIATMVHWIRHEKVMLDSDLAELYGVEVRVLNQAVKHNITRFPVDFMFRITAEKMDALRCQTVILKPPSSQGDTSPSETSSSSRSQIVILKRGQNIKFLPYTFTKQNITMLSSVLRSERAVEVNIAIMRTFVQLRRLMDSNRDLAKKIGEMEEKYDGQFRIVFDAIRQLMTPPSKPSRELGFHTIQLMKPTKKASRSRTKS